MTITGVSDRALARARALVNPKDLHMVPMSDHVTPTERESFDDYREMLIARWEETGHWMRYYDTQLDLFANGQAKKLGIGTGLPIRDNDYGERERWYWTCYRPLHDAFWDAWEIHHNLREFWEKHVKSV